jgi:hypothetical protein
MLKFLVSLGASDIMFVTGRKLSITNAIAPR